MKKIILKFLVVAFIILPGAGLIFCGGGIIFSDIPPFLLDLIYGLYKNGWAAMISSDILIDYDGGITAVAVIYSICILILGYALVKWGVKLWENLKNNH